MAIAAVKATKSSAAASSVSFAVAATAGNALLVGGASFQGTTWTVTRTGDTYTTDITGINGQHRCGIASAPNVAGGSVSLSAASTSAGGVDAWALEVSGLPTSSIRDATSPAVATGSSSAPATNSLTNVTADAIFLAATAQGSGANPATVTAAGGWTDTVGGTVMTELNGGVNEAGGQAYQIVAATGSKTASWTIDGTQTWSAVIAVYKMAGGGAAARPQRLMLLGVG